MLLQASVSLLGLALVLEELHVAKYPPQLGQAKTEGSVVEALVADLKLSGVVQSK